MKKKVVVKSLTNSRASSAGNVAVGASSQQRAAIAKSLAKESSSTVKRVTLEKLMGATSRETEKNLTRTLAAAKKDGAVLFFDEADALFGKRSEVKDSHDRYANVETDSLLQKIEKSGVTFVVGVHSDSAVDPATLKRWQRMVAVKTPPKPKRG